MLLVVATAPLASHVLAIDVAPFFHPPPPQGFSRLLAGGFRLVSRTAASLSAGCAYYYNSTRCSRPEMGSTEEQNAELLHTICTTLGFAMVALLVGYHYLVAGPKAD